MHTIFTNNIFHSNCIFNILQAVYANNNIHDDLSKQCLKLYNVTPYTIKNMGYDTIRHNHYKQIPFHYRCADFMIDELNEELNKNYLSDWQWTQINDHFYATYFRTILNDELNHKQNTNKKLNKGDIIVLLYILMETNNHPIMELFMILLVMNYR